MSLPEDFEFEPEVKNVVRTARKAGNLETLTPRMIRREIEQLFSLTSGTLDAKEYRKPLKYAIATVMNDSDTNEPGSSEKSTNKNTKMSKLDVEQSPKLTKLATKPRSKQTVDVPVGKKRKRIDAKQYKSSETVLSSDAEDEVNKEIYKNAVSSSSIDPISSSKPKKFGDSAKENEDDQDLPSKKRRKAAIESDIDEKSHSPHLQAVGEVTSIPSTVKVGDNGNENKSDSELSVLIDEPPKRKRKSKTKDKASGKPPTKEKKQKKSSVELSKDEETIKRLKSLVVGCGVRKVWSKIFQGIDQPSQQIKRLREILTELGMTGRMSLEQAKAIKQKRELAQELEDVQSFEKSVVTGETSRTRPKSRPTKSESDSGEGSGNDSDEPDVPTKRKNTARRSIMAFLGDESEE